MSKSAELDSPASPSILERPWIACYPEGVGTELHPLPYKLLAELPETLASRYPKAKAFTTIMPNGMEGVLNFDQVETFSGDFAAYLRQELRLPAGAKVGVQIPNGLAYPVIVFGIFKAGCVLVNINPLYTPREMEMVFKDSELSVLVSINMFAEKLQEAFRTTPVQHVVLTEAAEFFPVASRKLIGFVQKRIRKEIPNSGFAYTRLTKALQKGAKWRRHIDVKTYTSSLGGDTLACLQYTGGTTGVCKGAMLTHANLLANLAQLLSLLGEDLSNRDVILTALPLYHIFAFTVNFLAAFARGGHNILVPNPRPLTNLKGVFTKHEITFITGVNTLFAGLLNEPWFRENPPATLRVAGAGGTALQTAVAKRWQELTHIPIIQGYGLTEASPVVTFNPVRRFKHGTIGLPLPSTIVKCVSPTGESLPPGEPGELAACGPQIMAGYWKQPEETANVLRDGWLLTGDIAVMDEEGYFSIVDRRKDMVLVSGFNVYPAEVEDVISSLEDVKECAVIGVADPVSGEAVKAFVIAANSALTAEYILMHCRRNLAAYKVPKLIEFRSDLPKTPVGKILRKDLRAEEICKLARQ